MARERSERAFSLLEVVIVVAILAVLAAIGIPRLSRGTSGAADASLMADLRLLRHAIDHYALEHGRSYPTADRIGDQLTQYTDSAGDVQAMRDMTHCYGPYLRSIPPLPVGTKKGATGISNNAAAASGWYYTESTGAIRANCGPGEVDATGKPYRDY